MEAEIEFGFDRREMSHLANYDIYLDSDHCTTTV